MTMRCAVGCVAGAGLDRVPALLFRQPRATGKLRRIAAPQSPQDAVAWPGRAAQRPSLAPHYMTA